MSEYAVIGWGSLLWSPRGLAVAGDWSPQGPVLPIEFSRIAADGRLTLIVDERHGVPCATWVARSPLPLDEAVTNLAAREGCAPDSIGWLDRGSHPACPRPACPRPACQGPAVATGAVHRWCEHLGLRGAVWTALPSTFRERAGEGFSVGAALRYLEALGGSVRDRAFEYIRRAPATTATPVRRAFDERFREAHQIGLDSGG
jgi:hypothetical protein